MDYEKAYNEAIKRAKAIIEVAEKEFELGLKFIPHVCWRNAEEEQPESMKKVIIRNRETDNIYVLNNCLSVNDGYMWAYWDDVLKCTLNK